MVQRAVFDKTDLYLVRVFHTVVSERSVSRAALLLSSTQPQISAQLKRLRALIGDPLLVRSGTGMAPTEVALQLLGPADTLLRSAETLFSGKVAARTFVPATAETEFRVAASDYLDPFFLPSLIARIKQEAPRSKVTIHALSADFDYRAALARGELDLVIGNWLEPPEELHLGRLFSDDVVCLVAADHAAVRNPRAWTLERYLASEHLAPTAMSAGARGVIDEHLGRMGLQRQVAVRSPHFSLAPMLVAQSPLVLTTGRLFCSRYVDQFPVRIVPCPVAVPSLTYYQLWHDVAHNAASVRWLRETVRDVARSMMMRPTSPPRPRLAAAA
jgi:DNA-binding transcriptional LysR family regulator